MLNLALKNAVWKAALGRQSFFSCQAGHLTELIEDTWQCLLKVGWVSAASNLTYWLNVYTRFSVMLLVTEPGLRVVLCTHWWGIIAFTGNEYPVMFTQKGLCSLLTKWQGVVGFWRLQKSVYPPSDLYKGAVPSICKIPWCCLTLLLQYTYGWKTW